MRKILLAAMGLILICGCTKDDDKLYKNKDGSVFLFNGLGDLGTMSVVDKNGDINNDVISLGKWPNHIMEYDGRLYVTNSGNNNVQIIDADFSPIQ